MTVSNADLGIPEGRVCLTINEAAEILSCHERTVRNKIRAGKLHALQDEALIRIPVLSIRKFLGLD